ncbi:MAG: efflux RND transporter periplasmic adaptor subunit [Betaproteobacteria bacterium]|nr:efflux RND transporter periplasmic adaptor subunit [Betaproteobacteria bacterium]
MLDRTTVLLCLMLAMPAWAGPGHDHGDGAPVAASDAPKRQPDGSVFLPKAAQRQLQVRTERVAMADLAQTVELAGRVVADANAGGKVQSTQPGRIEAGPSGLPALGQPVRKGEVLAFVRASESATPELKVNLELARKKLARLEQLEGAVPQREIESARIEVESLGQRLSPSGGAMVAREALLAPVSGVIAATYVVAGQVVDAREVVYEVLDPQRLQVEALAYDAALPAGIEGAVASPAVGVRVPLQRVGAGRLLKEGAIPILFRIPPDAKAPWTLAVGQSLKVYAVTRGKVQGIAVPAAAVVKSPSNLDIVWVHTAAEHFVPLPVRWTALDGTTVAVLDGLKDGARVVTQGASLINQVR